MADTIRKGVIFMRLRICICLFVALSLISAASVFGYMMLWQDYDSLSRRYEESMEQTGFAAGNQGDNSPGKNEETAGTGQEHPASDTFYYVTLNNDEIIAYTGDHRQVCMRTRIDEEELAAALIQELKQGIYLENLPALYEYLENCSS